MSVRTAILCRHCQTPFVATETQKEFCCAGCQFVHHLLHKRGLGDFYKYGETKSPAGSFVFHEQDYEWLATAQKKAETAGRPILTLEVQGISCAGCVWLLETVFLEQPGAVSCRVQSSTGLLTLSWEPGSCDLAGYARDAARFGYLLGAAEATGRKTPMRPLVRKLGLCAALALNAMLFALPRYLGLPEADALTPLFDAISLALATLSMMIGGEYFFRRAAAALRAGAIHIDLPIALGLAAAYTGSVLAWAAGRHSFAYFDFVCIFTFLMLLGRWLQERAVESNKKRLLSLRAGPSDVRLEDGTSVSGTAVAAGANFTLAKGRTVPVRARLRSAQAVFALNWITGEPAPREYLRGAIVPAGARMISAGEADFEALEGWETSQLARLLATEKGDWRNESMGRVIRPYLSVVLVLAASGFTFWGLATGDWFRATQVLVSVLVVSCPCAIGVALPLLDDIAAARLQGLGVYVREGSLWARLRRVRTILFDKTGTLTIETLGLANPDAIAGLDVPSSQALLRLVNSSLHPVATCLREVLLARGIEPAGPSGEEREVTGMGIAWNDGTSEWRLGRPVWAGGRSGTAFTCDGRVLAEFHFREEIRPGARDQIRALRAEGRAVFLLSGDQPARVTAVATQLGLGPDAVLAGLTPEGKADAVRTRWAHDALMLGDGANDSLAFDAALCRGTPAAAGGLLEHKSDFYLLGNSLAGIGALFRTAARHGLTSRAVFTFAIVYNACAVAASLAGLMSPLVAAIIMPLSSLTSIGMVLIGFRNPNTPT